MLGSLIGAGNLAIQIWRDDKSFVKSAIKIPRIVQAAKENLHFPKYSAPHNFLNSLSKASVPYTLGPFFGVEMVGFYYLAERVMGTPSAFLINSIRRVFYQRASELYNQGKSFYRLLIKTFVGSPS